MTLDRFADYVVLAAFAVLIAMLVTPPLLFWWLRWRDARQHQHAVLRSFPLLGRVRYLLEHIGPELRQYLFNADLEGRPFARDEYLNVVYAGKYLKTLISFGSKRDFEQEGWYLRNALLPTPMDEMGVELEPKLRTRGYVIDSEGLFRRSEHVGEREMSPYTLSREHRPVLGADLARPWMLSGLVGMSGMSYGALGRHAIRALSYGVGQCPGAWMNTGEGGLSEHHLVGGGDVIFQIGPGLFGVRDASGGWDWDRFRRQAELGPVRGFELKLHQGAKIRGGHVEGRKVTPEIAEIRGVPVGQPIDSPNRFPGFDRVDAMLDHVARMREEGQKPVGLKLVVGGPGAVDDLAARIAARGDGPDWISVDGGEGGSGATYREMADTMGLPLRSALVELDDALRRHGVRDRTTVFASGKLYSADRIAIALCLGADAVAVGRSLMISVGCIQAMRCHANTCPVGVATTDEKLMRSLVVDEKRWRVLNYLITLRAGLTSLAAAAGLVSPTQFERRHAVFRDALGRIHGAEEIFPLPTAS